VASGVTLVLLAFDLSIIVLAIVAWIKIISKAGYSPWWILIGLVPFVNFIMLLVFAFSKWPVQQRLEVAQSASSGWGGAGGPRSAGGSHPAGAPPAPAGGKWDYLSGP
jgi:hypothetical protein